MTAGSGAATLGGGAMAFLRDGLSAKLVPGREKCAVFLSPLGSPPLGTMNVSSVFGLQVFHLQDRG